MEKSQTENLYQEIDRLHQRIVELEAKRHDAHWGMYADFLFENSGETILIIDPFTMNIIEANPNAARRLGYTQAELRQMKLDQLELPLLPDSQSAETSWQSSDSGTFYYEGRYRHKDGSLIPMEINSRMVNWEGQDVLINFVRDIRWRKEAENALRQLNNSLEQQVKERTSELAAEKEKLEAVLGSIVEAVTLTDAEKNILYVNSAFVTMTGYDETDVQAITFSSLFDCSQHDRKAQEEAFNLGLTWSGEVKGQRKDGRTYPTILTMVPMLNDQNQITGYVTSHQDLSRYQALDKAQYSFITNVSHQLRTPLTNIKLYTQLLGGSVQQGKPAHYLHVLTSQADRLEHLVQDILELASLESSEAALEWRSFNIADLILQLSEGNQSRARRQGTNLHCTIPENVPCVTGDLSRLRQSLNELLDNAFAYTSYGGQVCLGVATTEQNGRQWIVVSVRDDGPGIPAQEQPHIFERFFRGGLAEQGHISGTGLGLCIAQQIIQAHRGHIMVESKPNEGTEFSVWLPATSE